MKIRIKLFTTLTVFASLLLSANRILAQTVISASPYLTPPRDEIRSGTLTEQIVGGNATSETYLHSFGLNNYFSPGNLPQYMLDVYCDPSNGTLTDINVSSPTNKVGYRIGGQMVLWTAGNNSDIYVGINAGNIEASNCTAVGYNTLFS